MLPYFSHCLQTVFKVEESKKSNEPYSTVPRTKLKLEASFQKYLISEETKVISHLPRKYGLLRLSLSMGAFAGTFWKVSVPGRSVLPQWDRPNMVLNCTSVAIFKTALWYQASELLQQQCKIQFSVSALPLQRSWKQDPKQKLYQRLQIQLHSWVWLSVKQKNNVFVVQQSYREHRSSFIK